MGPFAQSARRGSPDTVSDTVPGLAHKAPVKASAFYEGINWVIVTFDFFPQRLTGYVKNKTVKKTVYNATTVTKAT